MIDSPVTLFDKSNIENIQIKLEKPKGTYAQIAATDSEQTELNKWIKQMFQDNSWQYQGIVLER